MQRSLFMTEAEARALLQGRFVDGEQAQAHLVHQVANLHISDKLVFPSHTWFTCTDKGNYVSYGALPTTGGDSQYSIHPHAFSQMCTLAKFKKDQLDTYASFGKPWAYELIDHNLNKLFHKREFVDKKGNPAMFLHRLVQVGAKGEKQVRGFLSRSFARHLASKPLLKGFIEACEGVGAKPIEASTSDVFFSLKCYLPTVYEPVPGDFVAFGVTWSNSDFGRGRLCVALTMMRIGGSTGHIIMNDAVSRRHIGSIIQESDIEVSDETALKEAAAQVSAIKDSVHELSVSGIDRMLETIAAAHEKKIPWSRIKSELGTLTKADIESLKNSLTDGVIDLPPPVDLDAPSRWWVANAVARIASRTDNQERKAELQSVAGSVIMT